MIIPPYLNPGDTIAIISPATEVKREYVEGAARHIYRRGYTPLVMPGANGPACGSFASTAEQRIADLRDTVADQAVKAVLCSRGGYGCVHLLPSLPIDFVRDNPTWIIGFSDVSALHALWHRAGVASIHAPMAKHLTIEPFHDRCSEAIFNILSGDTTMDYHVPAHPFNRHGEACGILRGGNLAVLNGLAATPYDILHADDTADIILFIEDISEAIYAVERMLTRLILSGTLYKIKGLIVGQFTEYRPDRNHESMEHMIDALLTRHRISGIPVVFGFPVGHVTLNYPLIEGAEVILRVDDNGTTLKSNSNAESDS